jgi:hypothetical protein
MVNSCRSGFDFDMRINRYLSPLLWWKSAFEDIISSLIGGVRSIKSTFS